MAFENFPYTNFHEINLDWIVARVKEAYSASNPPDYPVKSVNGMTGDVIIAIPANLVQSVNGETGDVILYRNPLVQFPTTTEQRWNLFRICDGDERGIEFDEDGAHRIEGTRRILIYDEENQPDFPVTSVNGQTGDVRITAGVNSVNGKTGNVVTPFVNPNADILTLDSNSNTILWGISRNVAGGNVALYISRGTGTPQAFIRYTPDQGEAVNLPLLSSADIPSETGVISVNTKTGVVTLYGTDIMLSENESTTIVEKFEEINNMLYPNIVDEQDWFRGLFYSISGAVQPNPPNANRYYSTSGYLIDECHYITTTLPDTYTFRVYVWSADNVYQGIVQNDNTIAQNNDNSKYFTEINIDDLKTLFPDMKFKLTMGAINPEVLPEDIQDYIIMRGDGFEDFIEKIETLQADDATHTQQITALQAKDTTHDQQISALQAKDTTHDQQISALQSAGTTHDQQISALQAEDTSLEQQISALQTADSTHDQQISALQAKDNTQDQQISELYTRAGVYVISITNANTLPLRYPASGTDEKIKDTNKVVSMDLSIPGAQGSNWTITTYNGYLEITGTMIGSSDITLYLA